MAQTMEEKVATRWKKVTPVKGVDQQGAKSRVDGPPTTVEADAVDPGPINVKEGSLAKSKREAHTIIPSKTPGKQTKRDTQEEAQPALGSAEACCEDDAAADPDSEEETAAMASDPGPRHSVEEPLVDAKPKRKKLSKEKLQKMKDEYRKRGVLYLSRIPPHMKPQKLRHMLSQHGEVLRVYLAPEDSAARMRRKKAGKDRGKNFTEGWVEFAMKKVAKRVAGMLNGEPMGGKRRSAYFYDLWNIKYLHKFKWDDLTAEIAYRSAVKEQRLAAEVSAAKRERDFYLSKVDQSRMINAMAERKRKRTGGEDAAAGAPPGDARPRVIRQFAQRRAVADPVGENKPRSAPDLLAKVFG